jgi:hypothetical protein
MTRARDEIRVTGLERRRDRRAMPDGSEKRHYLYAIALRSTRIRCPAVRMPGAAALVVTLRRCRISADQAKT